MWKALAGRTTFEFMKHIVVAFVVLYGLSIVSANDMPLAVVKSTSMEPSLYRGDVIVVHNSTRPFVVGEIVVFKIPDCDVPIVHRIKQIDINPQTNQQQILTKGDNNPFDDKQLYNGKPYIASEQIQGRVRAIIPWIGWISVLGHEYKIITIIILVTCYLYSS